MVYNKAPVVQKVDNAIQRISLYRLDNTYPLDSDLSGGTTGACLAHSRCHILPKNAV